MSKLYTGGVQLGRYFSLGDSAPIDDRFVVEKFNDLITNFLDDSVPYYTGLLVYVSSEKQFYVCTATNEQLDYLPFEDNPQDVLSRYWLKVGSGSTSTNQIISSYSNLTDGSNEFSKGSIAYVNNDTDSTKDGLYVLIGDDATDSDNWIKIGEKEVTIEDTGEELRSYLSSENTIDANTYYTSQGLNTYDEESGVAPVADYITLTNGGESYIKLFSGSDGNWIEMNIVDDSLGFSLSDVKVKSSDGTISSYTNKTQLAKGTLVCFGNDVDFTGFTETRPDGTTYTFEENGSIYEDIDIYSENDILDVTVYDGDKSAKILTDVDKVELEDKIITINNRVTNIYNTLQIDPDGEGSDEPTTLTEVIQSMNSAINKLEELDDISRISDPDIESLFNESEE